MHWLTEEADWETAKYNNAGFLYSQVTLPDSIWMLQESGNPLINEYFEIQTWF